MKTNIIIVFIIFIINACANPKETLLVGSWQAVELLEGNAPLELENIHIVRFHFNANQQYQFHGTLNYKEAGTYYVNTRYLFTTDTLNQATTEKAVEIVTLTEDSLFIKMNDSGKERVMKLVKVQ